MSLYPPDMTFAQAMRAGLVKPARDPRYLEYVAGLPCCITAQRPVTVHHIVGHGLKAAGGKTSDYLAIPLAPELHQNGPMALHVLGHKAWEEIYGSQLEFSALTLLQAIHDEFKILR